MKTDIVCGKIISACGNDCKACPRHMPKTDDELQKTAELWFKIGYRNRVVTNDEIKCYGCKTDNWCRYDIVHCVTAKGVDNCGKCEDYPCSKINEAFEKTVAFVPACKKICSSDEYDTMTKAFFEKKKNLDSIHLSLKK
jgi:hypothetical protein